MFLRSSRKKHRRAGKSRRGHSRLPRRLEQHPFYVSARVTLRACADGRGAHDEALEEFEEALTSAPDNLIALKGREEAREKRALPTLEKMAGRLTEQPMSRPARATLPRAMRGCGQRSMPWSLDALVVTSAANIRY
jgi:hypothetical protein